MRDQVETKLQQYRTEIAVGEHRLRELEAEELRVRETLLRIDGAVLALDELLRATEAEERDGDKRASADDARSRAEHARGNGRREDLASAQAR